MLFCGLKNLVQEAGWKRKGKGREGNEKGKGSERPLGQCSHVLLMHRCALFRFALLVIIG